MADLAIRVENLSKQYKLGATVRHDRLKDLLTSGLNGLFRRSRSLVPGPPSSDGANPQSEIRNPKSDYIWALKDVSFEVKQGETLGIIGPNGAGKSTLLKILSRITEPTEGRAEIYGRVGSLLEVGIGFDRELTGRENIYLNGAILGMKNAEIDRKFDEIVDFSGVERFIDTPVKRYSTGMHVRLAFAVAAHLDPEILIVDEVLAVGDAAFQKKCLGKMQDVAKGGRTVLFVSHNMEAVQRICQNGILLLNGTPSLSGVTQRVVEAYLDSIEGTKHTVPVFAQASPFTNVHLNVNGQFPEGPVVWRTMSRLEVSVSVGSLQPVTCPRIDIACFDMNRRKLFAIQSDRVLDHSIRESCQHWRMDFRIDRLVVAPQRLYLDVGLRQYHQENYVVIWERACEIMVVAGGLNRHVTEDSLLLPAVEILVNREQD